MTPGGVILLQEEAAEPRGPGPLRDGDQGLWAIEGHWAGGWESLSQCEAEVRGDKEDIRAV